MMSYHIIENYNQDKYHTTNLTETKTNYQRDYNLFQKIQSRSSNFKGVKNREILIRNFKINNTKNYP